MNKPMQIKITANQDFTAEIETLKNLELQEWVKDFIQLPSIKVNFILSDGFDGNALQVNFETSVRSFVAHDLTVLDMDLLTAIGSRAQKGNSTIPGFECEIHSVDEGEFALIVGAE